MSLNLGPPGSSGRTFADCLEDQTPTPTRFIRNCEEVGLFQDLQNVNPFDEQFSQATSPTTNFDICGNPNSSSFRHFPDNSDLNTPQIKLPGYTPAPAIKSVEGNNSISKPIPNSADTKTSEDGKKIRHKSKNLKLNLCTSPTEKKTSPLSPLAPSQLLQHSSTEGKNSPDPDKKKEILERNREAAFRARARRKQWVAELEVKCKMLESSLAHSQSDLIKQRAENQLLREELRKHYEHCQMGANSSSISPRILRTPAPLRPEMEIIPPAAIPSAEQQIQISRNIVASVAGRKRGRPRKGEERRPRIANTVISVVAPQSQISTSYRLIPVTLVPHGTLPNVVSCVNTTATTTISVTKS